MSSKIFSIRLRKARERRNLKQSELAERAGLQAAAVSHFETGRRAPSFDNLRRLADTLNVTTDYLIGRAEDPVSSGPNIDKLFRNAGEMSEADLEALADFAEILATKNKKGGS
jgi:transcriptional regulator with XRE-family HTH domain